MKLNCKHIFLSLIFIYSFYSFGFSQEVKSARERFALDYNKGCAQLPVNITLLKQLGPTESDQYQYKEELDFTSDKKFTYNEPGEYYLIQIIGAGADNRDSIKVEVLEPRPVDFTVYNCNNNIILLEINDDYYDSYQIDYGDGTIIPTTSKNTSHSYGVQGSYEITVTGLFDNAKNNCKGTPKQITTVNELEAAQINTVEVIDIDPDDGDVRLDYSLNPNVMYKLEMLTNGTGTPVELDINNSSDTLIENLDTRNNFYCFTIFTIDPCNNSRTSQSDTVCSIKLDVIAENEQNRLEWSPSGFTSHKIIRDGQPFRVLGQGVQTFADRDIICNVDYCYKVTGIKPSNGSEIKSISGEICVKAISDEMAPPVNNITASIESSNIFLKWSEPSGSNPGTYFIQRAMNNNSFAPLDSSNVNSFTDTGLNTNEIQYCYKINYVDECGNLSEEGVTGCPVLLEGKQNNNGTIELHWTDYQGWENGVKEYIVEVLDENGNLQDSFNANLTTQFLDAVDTGNQVKFYRIKARSADQDPLTSFSNILKFIAAPVVFLPDAFTPNGDGLNDEYVVQGQFIKEFKLRVYNRWGELIFYSNDQEKGWNGNFKGEKAPQGTYIYKYNAIDFAGQNFNKSGSFVLLR